MSTENAPTDLNTTDAAYAAFDKLFPNGLPEDSGTPIPETASAAAVSEETTNQTTETPVEPEGESVTGISDSPSPEMQLLQALKNPALAPAALAELAKLSGVKPETGQSAKSIAQEIQEGLGEDFAFLGEKLAPLLEKVIKRGIEEGTATEKQTLQEITARSAEARVAADLDTFQKANPHIDAAGFKAMNDLAQKISPKGLSQLEYMDLLAKGCGLNKTPIAKSTGPKTPALDNGVQPQVKSVPLGNLTPQQAAELAYDKIMAGAK